jgi:hypothetical protein
LTSGALLKRRTIRESPFSFTRAATVICDVERFHRTVLNKFYRVAFRRNASIDELQHDLDLWLKEYNETRPHQGRWCYGKPRCRPLSMERRWRARRCSMYGAQEGLA